MAYGPLTLSTDNGCHEPLRLTVRDVLGRALATAPAATNEPIIFNNLPAGTYLLKAEGATGARNTVRK